jgi:glycosyltransferase involved in cell wall biosynthesis
MNHHGGVQSVVRGLVKWLSDEGSYRPTIISLAASRSDELSRRLLNPPSWIRPSLRSPESGLSEEHWGANFAEFEPWRYRPRKELTSRLREFDVIQVVSGSLGLANAVLNVGRPVVAQVATRFSWERASQISPLSYHERLLRNAMLKLVNNQEVFAARHVDNILVENRRMENYLLSELNLPRNVVRYMPPGIDTVRFSPIPVESRQGYLLSLCRLDDERKGLDRLLEAYRILRSRKADCPTLVIAGSGELPLKYSTQIQNDQALSTVRVLRNVSDDALPALYAGAALFIQTSHEEGLGLSVLESLSCGVPVVATETDGTLETIQNEENGYLIAQGELASVANAVSDAVLRYLDRPPRAMSARARATVEQNYSADLNFAAYLATYKTLVSAS